MNDISFPDPEYFKQYKLKKLALDGLSIEQRVDRLEKIVNLLEIQYNGAAIKNLSFDFRQLFEETGVVDEAAKKFAETLDKGTEPDLYDDGVG